MLNDERIASLLVGTTPLVTDVSAADYTSKDGPIQPGSVDLSVGEIYRPRVKSWFGKRSDSPLTEVVLEQGETVIIRTKEKLNLPSNVAAIVFPPARVSTRGVLMTNAGHVDPGYRGFLHLTVINMGKQKYTIRTDDRLVSALFFELTSKAKKDWLERRNGQEPTDSPLMDTARNSLSRDFLDVQERARSEASKAVVKAALWQAALPIFASIVTALLTVYVYSQQNSAAIARLEGRLAGLGADVNLDNLDNRVSNLEKKVK
jgi:deoxycytidine triphosphate deaminase